MILSTRDAKFIALGKVMCAMSVVAVVYLLYLDFPTSFESPEHNIPTSEVVQHGNRIYLLETNATSAADSGVCSATLYGGKVCAEESEEQESTWWLIIIAHMAVYMAVSLASDKVKECFATKIEEERALR